MEGEREETAYWFTCKDGVRCCPEPRQFFVLNLHASSSFSVIETQQPYPHMAKDLKQNLRHKLDQIAPEYGLVELSYPSFTRCYGWLSQPISACDAVEAISALLDVAGGVRMEVEIEGARNGGEWFGGGKLWEVGGREGRRDDERENVPRGGLVDGVGANGKVTSNGGDGDGEAEESGELQWWVKNFWTAFDALNK